MTSALTGLVLGLLIGSGCRWFDIPLPAPPRLVGALLVVAMTLGFLATDLLLAPTSPVASHGPASASPAG
jgi:XapX domain-containing protein